jgi:hypothetical protein
MFVSDNGMVGLDENLICYVIDLEYIRLSQKQLILYIQLNSKCFRRVLILMRIVCTFDPARVNITYVALLVGIILVSLWII